MYAYTYTNSVNDDGQEKKIECIINHRHKYSIIIQECIYLY